MSTPAELALLQERDRRRGFRLLAWSGPASIVIVLVGWGVLAGFVPPPSPDMRAEEVAALWREDPELKRLGLTMCVWGGALYVLFAAGIAQALRRVAGSSVLALAQFGMGAFGMVFFCWNFLLLATVGYRPDQPAEIVRAFSDVGFLMTFPPVQPFTLQVVLIGVVILQDRRPVPLIPRWLGFVNLWVGFLFLPAQAAVFLHDGPVAWDGFLTFWVPVGVFAIWFPLMCWAMLRMRAEDPAAAAAPA